MPRTIVLKGDPITKEEKVSESITPGHLVEFVPSGGSAGQLRKHANAGQDAAPIFAIERDYIGGEIDDAYSTNEFAKYVVARAGDELYAWIPAGAAAIKKGDLLQSAGSGNLRKHTAAAQAVNEGGSASYTVTQYTRAVVAQAMEDKDNSGGGAAVRLIVQVI